MIENRRDLSISMQRANILLPFIALPGAVLQFIFYNLLHAAQAMEVTWHFLILLGAVVLGIVLHELIHGMAWAFWGRKPFSAIQFGFQWKTITPYAHLKEPVDVDAYRIGAFLPGFMLGILVYILSLVLGDGNLFWFSLFHTAASGGDWLVLWLLRGVKSGSLVEDHPSNAGCYVLEAGS